MQFYISDLASEVLIKCENKVTQTARANQWLVDALLEISGNPDYRDDFVELEEWGPTFVLTGGSSIPPAIQEYDEMNLIPDGDVLLNTLDILLWSNYPTNTVRYKLNVTTYQKADRFQPITSLPVEWYRFTTTIGFNPCPDQNYQVQARVLRRHPIDNDDIGSTIILIPREWNETLVLAAAIRGFTEVGEYEKATNIRSILYGDPRDSSRPGIIYSVKRKDQKENWRSEKRLNFVRRASMFGG
jgi:hypothetical protein